MSSVWPLVTLEHASRSFECIRLAILHEFPWGRPIASTCDLSIASTYELDTREVAGNGLTQHWRRVYPIRRYGGYQSTPKRTSSSLGCALPDHSLTSSGNRCDACKAHTANMWSQGLLWTCQPLHVMGVDHANPANCQSG